MQRALLQNSLTLFAVMLLVSMVSVAEAQMPSFQPDWAAWGAQTLSNQQWVIQKEIHKKDWERDAARHKGSDGRSAALSSTHYTPSPAVASRVREQFLQFVASRSGSKGREAVTAAFQKTNPLQAWAQNAVGDGLHANDVADAFTEYWVTNWQMANNVMHVPGNEVRAVRDQFRPILLSNPAFVRLTEARKQEMAEIYIYNDVLQGTIYQEAAKKGDHTLQQRLGDAAVERFKNEMHVDLRQIALSGRGFIVKR